MLYCSGKGWFSTVLSTMRNVSIPMYMNTLARTGLSIVDAMLITRKQDPFQRGKILDRSMMLS
jgi:hypothetical protein